MSVSVVFEVCGWHTSQSVYYLFLRSFAIERKERCDEEKHFSYKLRYHTIRIPKQILKNGPEWHEGEDGHNNKKCLIAVDIVMILSILCGFSLFFSFYVQYEGPGVRKMSVCFVRLCRNEENMCCLQDPRANADTPHYARVCYIWNLPLQKAVSPFETWEWSRLPGQPTSFRIRWKNDRVRPQAIRSYSKRATPALSCSRVCLTAGHRVVMTILGNKTNFCFISIASLVSRYFIFFTQILRDHRKNVTCYAYVVQRSWSAYRTKSIFFLPVQSHRHLFRCRYVKRFGIFISVRLLCGLKQAKSSKAIAPFLDMKVAFDIMQHDAILR